MPSTIAHGYQFFDTYKHCSREFQRIYPQEFYNLFLLSAQGHDALFFSDFWNLPEFDKKRKLAIYLQDHQFQQFCVEYIDLLGQLGLKDSRTLKMLIYGYISHHILDSYTHPYIIYETGTNGMHELVESYIDKYMIMQREMTNPNSYKVHHLMPKLPRLSGEEINLVNEAFFNTYGFKQFGKTYIDALNQVNLFLRLFRYDPTYIKDFGYSLIDKTNLIGLKFSFLSYSRDYKGFEPYLNEDHQLWFNPYDPNISSTSSFFDLYDLALVRTAGIISELETAINDRANCQEIMGIIPDVSAIHGLKCDQNLELKTLRKTPRKVN